MQAYVSRMAALLQLSNGDEHSQAGRQAEVTQNLRPLGCWFFSRCMQLFWFWLTCVLTLKASLNHAGYELHHMHPTVY